MCFSGCSGQQKRGVCVLGYTERGKEEIRTGKERMKNKIVDREKGRRETETDRDTEGRTDRHAGRDRQRETERQTERRIKLSLIHI